jgi:hypothetical protein
MRHVSALSRALKACRRRCPCDTRVAVALARNHGSFPEWEREQMRRAGLVDLLVALPRIPSVSYSCLRFMGL